MAEERRKSFSESFIPRGTGSGASVLEVVCQVVKEEEVAAYFLLDHCPGTPAVQLGLQVPHNLPVVFLQRQRGRALPGEVLLRDFLQGCLQTVPLLAEFHIQVLNDGLVPAGAGEIPSENPEDLLQHLVDDQDGVLLPELLWLFKLLRELEVHPVVEAILRGSIQLPQELLAGQVGVALLESKQVVAQGKSCSGETQQDGGLEDALVGHDDTGTAMLVTTLTLK